MEQLKLRVRNGICICFTAQGKETATRLLEKLSQQMEEAFDFLDYTGSEHSKPLKQVVKEAFQEKEAILFVGAAGIAVRLIAPWVQDKLKDPAVLVIDEQGRYAIPILSGHVGGCNELAEAAAQILGAEPVITTATDLRQAFAVDVFAADVPVLVPVAFNRSARIQPVLLDPLYLKDTLYHFLPSEPVVSDVIDTLVPCVSFATIEDAVVAFDRTFTTLFFTVPVPAACALPAGANMSRLNTSRLISPILLMPFLFMFKPSSLLRFYDHNIVYRTLY